MPTESFANQIDAVYGASSSPARSLARDMSLGRRHNFTFFILLAEIANDETIQAMPGVVGSITAAEVNVGFTPASTASKLATLTTCVGGTSTTGGAMALTTANMAADGRVAATAITAGGSFTATQKIGVKASSVTTFGEGNAYVTVFYLES